MGSPPQAGLLRRDPKDCGGHRVFPAFPVLVQPMSVITFYFPTVVICNKPGTRGASGTGRAEPCNFLSVMVKARKQ